MSSQERPPILQTHPPKISRPPPPPFLPCSKRRPSAAELLQDPWLKKGLLTTKLVEILRDVPPPQRQISTSTCEAAAPAGIRAASEASADEIDSPGGNANSGGGSSAGTAAANASNFADGTTWNFGDDQREALRTGVNVERLDVHQEEGAGNEDDQELGFDDVRHAAASC